jgi:hypothetical protein
MASRYFVEGENAKVTAQLKPSWAYGAVAANDTENGCINPSGTGPPAVGTASRDVEFARPRDAVELLTGPHPLAAPTHYAP